MLVLSRKTDERVWIGDNICITIVRSADGRVRLGIDAPRDLPIHRDEVRQRILADREAQDTAHPAIA